MKILALGGCGQKGGLAVKAMIAAEKAIIAFEKQVIKN